MLPARKLVAACLAAVAAAVVVVPRLLDRLEARSYQKAAEIGLAWMRQAHSQTDRYLPAGAVLFIGDSITQSLPVDEVTPRGVNFGIGWQRSEQLLETMPIYRSMSRAEAVFIMIGTNDLIAGGEAGYAERLRSILSTVPAGPRIVVSSPPPLGGHDSAGLSKAAHDACAADVRCSFLDAHALLSASGAIGPDGVHLTPAGYALLVREMRHRLGTPSAESRVFSRA